MAPFCGNHGSGARAHACPTRLTMLEPGTSIGDWLHAPVGGMLAWRLRREVPPENTVERGMDAGGGREFRRRDIARMRSETARGCDAIFATPTPQARLELAANLSRNELCHAIPISVRHLFDRGARLLGGAATIAAGP